MIWLGFALSYGFIFLVIGISTLLQNLKVFGEEGARKFIHIGVSNWIIIAMIYFKDNVWAAIIPPVTFIALNYLSYRMNLIKAMERGGKGNLGTVWFPVSLLVLVALSFGFDAVPVHAALIGILVMGYGDGLAAVIGTAYGRHPLIFGKSVEGTAAMFVASFVVTAVALLVVAPAGWLLSALVVALFATAIELVTPKGLDNLSVPGVAFLAYMLISLII
jgi:phytol kinase